MEASSSDEERPRRVDIGFAGGQVLTLRLREPAYIALNEALQADATRWHAVTTEDSEVTVDLGQVVYVRLDTETSRVGF